jgi:hypothetical protein
VTLPPAFDRVRGIVSQMICQLTGAVSAG